MPLKEVHSIELDMNIYHSAYIVWRRRDGSVVRKVKVKWNQRWDAFGKAHKAWFRNKFELGDAR